MGRGLLPIMGVGANEGRLCRDPGVETVAWAGGGFLVPR